MARQITRDGLILWWDGINNTSEGTHGNETAIWYDLSGNGNHCIINKLYNGAINWGRNYLDCSDRDRGRAYCYKSKTEMFYEKKQLTFEITVSDIEKNTEGWIKNLIRVYQWNDRLSATGFFYITLETVNNQIVFRVGARYGSRDNDKAEIFLPYDWQEDKIFTLTVILDYNTIYLYLNGKLINSALGILSPFFIFSETKDDEENGFFIFDNYFSDSRGAWYTGKLYSLRIYDRALTDNEVYYNYIAEMDHLKDPEEQIYPDIPIVRPDGSIIDPVQDGEVSRVAIGDNEIYNVKDIKARTTKLDKYKDEQVYGVVSFINGIQVDVASIKYDPANNTVVFK